MHVYKAAHRETQRLSAVLIFYSVIQHQCHSTQNKVNVCNSRRQSIVFVLIALPAKKQLCRHHLANPLL